MPNHLHGIIEILPKDNDFDDCNNCRDTLKHVSTENAKNEFGKLKSKSLSLIINNFKGGVTRYCNKNDLAYFQWQSGYYEHVIRNEKDLVRIKKYIADNPLNWEFDRNNPKNFQKG